MPFVSPVNVCPVLLDAFTQDAPLSRDTSYLVIGLVPGLDGAIQLSVAWPLPGVAVKLRGAVGTLPATGVAVIDTCAPGPTLLTALTLNVWLTPFASPVNVCPVLLDAFTHVVPLSRDTSYLVIGLVPALAGAIQLSVTWPLPGVAAKLRGTVGGVPIGSDERMRYSIS